MASKKEKVSPPPPEEKQSKEEKGIPEVDENLEEKDKSQREEKTPEVAENLAGDQEETSAGGGEQGGEPLGEEPGDESKASGEQPDPDANLEWPEEDTSSGEESAPQEEVAVQDVQFDQIKPQQSSGQPNNIDILLDVDLPISVQLGKTTMTIQELLEVGPGSVIELDKMVGNPVEILANNKTIAQGEVVVVDENFGVKITSLISAEERIKSLR